MLHKGHNIGWHCSTPVCKLPPSTPSRGSRTLISTCQLEAPARWTNVSYLLPPRHPIPSPASRLCRSYPTVHLLSADKALIVERENHRTHMLWRRGSEWSQIGPGCFRAHEQGTGKTTGVGVKCAGDLKVGTGPEFTGDLNMENGKTETEDMMEGVSKAWTCFLKDYWRLEMN